MTAPKRQTRAEIFALVPLKAVRIKVQDEKGFTRYRAIDPENKKFDDVLDSDSIILDDNGLPIVMEKVPGRKKSALVPKSPPPVSATVAQLKAAKEDFLNQDPLLNQVEQGIDSEDVIMLVMRGFAQEAASLEFERIEAERTGKETSQYSIRRINALKALGETFIKRKEQLAGKIIDLESAAFSRLFAFMMETFREAMLAGGIPRDQVETIFSRLSDRITDETWESEARLKMKGD